MHPSRHLGHDRSRSQAPDGSSGAVSLNLQIKQIVQVPLELPQPSIGALSAAVQRGVEKMPFKTRFDDDELKRIGTAIYNVTLRANTMRDVHRVLNVFEADWLASQEKISPADLLSMSLLRVMYPKMLPWIRSRSSVLAGSSSDGYVISQAEVSTAPSWYRRSA